jgi:hypothetical protein
MHEIPNTPSRNTEPGPHTISNPAIRHREPIDRALPRFSVGLWPADQPAFPQAGGGISMHWAGFVPDGQFPDQSGQGTINRPSMGGFSHEIPNTPSRNTEPGPHTISNPAIRHREPIDRALPRFSVGLWPADQPAFPQAGGGISVHWAGFVPDGQFPDQSALYGRFLIGRCFM